MPRPSSKSLIGQAAVLKDLIKYQPNSIVSRQIIQKNVGSVTLFAFDQGQELSEHTAPYDALVYIVDGQGEIVIAGKPQKLSAGEMIVMPAKKPHAVKAPQAFKMLLVMIRA